MLLSAGRDATVSGSQVIADRDLDVLAGRDANLLAAQNTYSEEHRFKSKSSSVQLIGGAAPRQTLYGTNRAAQQSTGSGSTATASLLSANAGNLTVTAGTDAAYKNTGRGNVTSEGADLLAGRDLRLEGNAVNLLASEANSQLDSVSKTKSFTVGAALAGTVGGTITRAYDMAKAAADGTRSNRGQTTFSRLSLASYSKRIAAHAPPRPPDVAQRTVACHPARQQSASLFLCR